MKPIARIVLAFLLGTCAGGLLVLILGGRYTYTACQGDKASGLIYRHHRWTGRTSFSYWGDTWKPIPAAQEWGGRVP